MCTTQVPLRCLQKPLPTLGLIWKLDMLAFGAGIGAGLQASQQASELLMTTKGDTELRLHQHFDTHTESSCSLHKAANLILCWIGTAKKMVPTKRPNSAEIPSRHVLDKPILGHQSAMVATLQNHSGILKQYFRSQRQHSLCCRARRRHECSVLSSKAP